MRCPDCGGEEFRSCRVFCEDCGDHCGAQCKECGSEFDNLFSPIDERLLAANPGMTREEITKYIEGLTYPR
jgi:hypothetical protein